MKIGLMVFGSFASTVAFIVAVQVHVKNVQDQSRRDIDRQIQQQVQQVGAPTSEIIAASQSSTHGHVASSGEGIVPFSYDVAKCSSGELDGFFGVTFESAAANGPRIRLVRSEATGDVIKVMREADDPKSEVIVPASACTVFDRKLQKTNFSEWTPRGKVRHLDGHLHFDCRAGKSGHITGDVDFQHCH